MGIKFTDNYSLLHIASGIIIYYWGVLFWNWFIIHLLYEYFENTTYGIWFINNLTFWPGGRKGYDSITNMIGDQFYGLFGWLLAYYYNKILYNNVKKDVFL